MKQVIGFVPLKGQSERKILNSLEGIETGCSLEQLNWRRWRKILNSLEGIETRMSNIYNRYALERKILNSLEGIETGWYRFLAPSKLKAKNTEFPGRD